MFRSVTIIRELVFEPSSSSSSSCSLRVRRFSCSLILKVELVPPSLFRSSHVPISVPVLASYLCPSSVCVVATFSGTFLFPVLCSVLPFFPLCTDSFLYPILLFLVSVCVCVCVYIYIYIYIYIYLFRPQIRLDHFVPMLVLFFQTA